MTDAQAERASTTQDGAAIQTDGLVVDYGRRRAVDGLDTTVPRGAVYGFLGPNGAGKTSTIETLVATVITLYLVFSIPEILRIPLEIFFSTDGNYEQNWRIVEGWYESFQVFRPYDYWAVGNFYQGPFGGQQASLWISVVVCVVTAAVPLLAALWLFRRKAQ